MRCVSSGPILRIQFLSRTLKSTKRLKNVFSCTCPQKRFYTKQLKFPGSRSVQVRLRLGLVGTDATRLAKYVPVPLVHKNGSNATQATNRTNMIKSSRNQQVSGIGEYPNQGGMTHQAALVTSLWPSAYSSLKKTVNRHIIAWQSLLVTHVHCTEPNLAAEAVKYNVTCGTTAISRYGD